MQIIFRSILQGMSKLQHLDLSKNRIKSIEKLAFGTFDGAGTSLVRLNLAGNQIETVADPGAFLYMSALAYLDLSHNLISLLSQKAFARLAGLESLFLQVINSCMELRKSCDNVQFYPNKIAVDTIAEQQADCVSSRSSATSFQTALSSSRFKSHNVAT